MQPRRAFTMLELLLVLTVLGVLSALAAARLGNMRVSQGVEQAATLIQEQALRAQRLARSQGEVVRMRIDPTALTVSVVRIAGAQQREPNDGLPASLLLYAGAETVRISRIRNDGVEEALGVIDTVFYPDARCDTPGGIAVECGGRSALVLIAAGARPATVEIAP